VAVVWVVATTVAAVGAEACQLALLEGARAAAMLAAAARVMAAVAMAAAAMALVSLETAVAAQVVPAAMAASGSTSRRQDR